MLLALASPIKKFGYLTGQFNRWLWFGGDLPPPYRSGKNQSISFCHNDSLVFFLIVIIFSVSFAFLAPPKKIGWYLNQPWPSFGLRVRLFDCFHWLFSLIHSPCPRQTWIFNVFHGSVGVCLCLHFLHLLYFSFYLCSLFCLLHSVLYCSVSWWRTRTYPFFL